MKVFVSYSHLDGDWVCDRLVPCLKAGGAEVLIDCERFKVGKGVIGQMNVEQDQAEKTLLVLSPDYLNSDYCRYEMQRAIKKDPSFTTGFVAPVVRRDCSLPKPFNGKNSPLYADLRDDNRPEPWNALLNACGAIQLGAEAPDWLAARDEIVQQMNRNKSINLVAQGKANWRSLLEHLGREEIPGLACVNLEDPDTVARSGLLTAILRSLGSRASLPGAPWDLAEFKRHLLAGLTDFPARVALTHFDLVPYRSSYDVDMFATLRYLIMELRSLVLLIQSRTPLGALLPPDHPISPWDVTTVELRSKA